MTGRAPGRAVAVGRWLWGSEGEQKKWWQGGGGRREGMAEADGGRRGTGGCRLGARRGRLGAVERKPREAVPLRPGVREAGIAAVWGRIRGALKSPLYTCAAGPHVRRVYRHG